MCPDRWQRLPKADGKKSGTGLAEPGSTRQVAVASTSLSFVAGHVPEGATFPFGSRVDLPAVLLLLVAVQAAHYPRMVDRAHHLDGVLTHWTAGTLALKSQADRPEVRPNRPSEHGEAPQSY